MRLKAIKNICTCKVYNLYKTAPLEWFKNKLGKL